MSSPLLNISVIHVERILHLLGGDWLGPWQRRAVEAMLTCGRGRTIQLPRQTGKTYAAALVAVAVLMCGGSVIIGMPTMTQSTSLLFSTIASMMDKLCKLIPGRMLRVKHGKDGAAAKEYTNGGKLRAISQAQMDNRDTPPEGYTADMLIIDEAHRAERAMLGICMPFLTQAKRKGHDRALLLGVGGHDLSLIEEMKVNGFEPFMIKPGVIVQEDPSYGAVFADFKRILTPVDYDSHIELLPVSEGLRRIFPDLQRAVAVDEVHRWDNLAQRYYFGIDVGRTSDLTVVAVLRRTGRFIDFVDYHEDTGPFVVRDGNGIGQADRIVAFVDQYIYNDENIAIEINGMGCGLYDILHAHPFYRMQAVQLDYDYKKAVIDQMVRDCRDGIFRVSDSTTLDELKRLKFEIKMSSTLALRYEWEHSDKLSAIIMAYAAMQTVQVL